MPLFASGASVAELGGSIGIVMHNPEDALFGDDEVPN